MDWKTLEYPCDYTAAARADIRSAWSHRMPIIIKAADCVMYSIDSGRLLTCSIANSKRREKNKTDAAARNIMKAREDFQCRSPAPRSTPPGKKPKA